MKQQKLEAEKENENIRTKSHLYTHHTYKLLKHILIILFILSLINKDLLAQNNNNSSSNYSFFENENIQTFNHDTSGKPKTFFSSFSSWSREKKTIGLNVAAVAATMIIGAASWDYYSSSFEFRNEGWLDPDTNYGGADKFGHAFGGYALTSIYNSIYKKFGYSNEEAITLAALSSWSLMTLIEVGDGFSKDYGFSVQDETFNTAGVGLAFLRHRYPFLKDIFDYRLEWVPSRAFKEGEADPFTDYSGQKNLIALKLGGILNTDNEVLKALELDFGFYTRGYEDSRHTPRRYLFYGVGLNMTYVLEQITGHRFGGVFDYLQIPFTYISYDSEFD